MNHECERCLTTSSIFWHTIGYGCSETGDGAIKVFEFCDDCLYDLIMFMKKPKYRIKSKNKPTTEDNQ